MLEKLLIKNFIIIDNLELDLNKGLNCFIGETGAGKSIVVDAISYLTGARIDKNILKDVKQNCILEAYFSLDNDIKKILEENGYEYDDYLIITRIINSDNKSIIKINSQTTTLSFLKNIFEFKIDIHSQKENQYLLNEKNHLKILDSYILNQEIFYKIKETYYKLQESLKTKNDLLNIQYNEHDLELMNLEVQEIEDAAISNQEYEQLIEKEKEIKNYLKNSSKLKEALNLFEADKGIDEQLYSSIDLLECDDNINDIKIKINDYYYLLKDEYQKLKQYIKSSDIDEQEINYIQERLFIYAKMKRKYGQDINNIINHLNNLKIKINDFNNKDQQLLEIDKKIASDTKDYYVLANEISKQRKEISLKIEEEVMDNLKHLEFKNARFKINFDTKEISSDGIDKVEFFVALNSGKKEESISKTASGGELSRILLALKSVFSKNFKIDTIIFDEIDVGVSGKASNAIGVKMAEMSLDSQIITITHSTQVASYANSCFLVSKSYGDNDTTTIINKLSGDELIYHLSIISNPSVTEYSINATRLMYQEAQKFYENK